MKITFLGGCREVGKSALLLEKNDHRILLDYGVKLQPEPSEFPEEVRDVEVVFPTHAHLDHSGAIPVLFHHSTPAVMATKVTIDLMELLLRDFVKVMKRKGMEPKFDKDDVAQVIRASYPIIYENPIFLHGMKFVLHPSGHIPGSAYIEITSDRKRIVYTGDIKLRSQRLTSGAKLTKGKVDVLIMECTYGDKDHPERRREEKRLKEEIDATINQGEVVLIPSFAVARAQELLLVLKDYKSYIALDGMAKEATEIMLRNPSFLLAPKELRKVYGSIKRVKNQRERKRVLKRKPIVISTSGMLNGGPVLYYLKRIKDKRESLLAFVGFQVEGTPGRSVLETGIYRNDETWEVNCRIRRFDFSSHAGRNELFELVERLEPSLVVCVHGDKCEEFAKEIEERYGITTLAPKEGEELKL